ncbi:MAG TPA: M28 family peptidase [Verrucomicrobiae bacterium]|nr:M28 family peptidase [Verrucomicrobiae bacterium]
MPRPTSVDPARIRKHWSCLCSKIGERRAGSPGDSAAAHYILSEFRAAGLDKVYTEPFECVSVLKAEAELAMGSGARLEPVPARVLAGAPSTQGARPVETELIWIEMPEQAERLLQPRVRGKVVVLVGPMPTRADLHRRLVACRPAAVIHVDDRLPFEWVKDDGVYPAWAKKYGMPPTITIPYRMAWDLRKASANRARVRVQVQLAKRVCHNVVGEIPGRRPELPLVLLGAHHDTQCNNTGADDNASGVVALLALGNQLAVSRPLRTIRLVSFGAEEQLSVGSAEYARAHRQDMASLGAVLNLDSVSSPLGHHWLIRAGRNEFAAWLLKRLAHYGLDAVEKSAPMPFADHFPFSAFGVPSVTFMRPNMDSGMRWQHHSAQDNLENVSVDELQRVIGAVGAVAADLARAAQWPFGRGVAPEHQAETDRLARELFGFKPISATGRKRM